ncbi:hypothetical protein [Gelria sp. Kuro-4]|uniref:hypothetical protein n=1 Tax=Gelria sp. Kuro-4 TaxID=2796927 RepID=UPI001BEDAB04|nr:hypothetical protein [Gelria sp. Kuro-4]BCV23293.1 hypothetical protein kuro4_00660 [Gelria sp. Kuro-4]
MGLVVAVMALVAFLCYREWYHSKELEKLEDRYFKERQTLLDRLMARDFTQYKQAEFAERIPVQLPEMPEDTYDFSEVGN